MLHIIRRTAMVALLLMMAPLIVWLSGWQWQPGQMSPIWLKGFFIVTETVSRPWGIFTAIILSIGLLFSLKLPIKPMIMLFCTLNAVILVGQGITSLLKQEIKEPRPYIVWLKTNFSLNEQQFYALPEAERRMIVGALTSHNDAVPAWQLKHWKQQIGPSFPSGHTLFAASWVLLIAGLTGLRAKRNSMTWMVILWALIVLISRLLLGMHWPRDVLASVVIAWLLVIPTLWLMQRWMMFRPSLREQQRATRQKRLFSKRKRSNKF